jgi:hypothetical protein
VHHEVEACSTGNVIPQQSTDLLTISCHIEYEEDEAGAVETVELPYLKALPM